MQNPVNQHLIAVHDDFEPKFFDVRAGMAGAGIGAAEFRQFFAEAPEKFQHLPADVHANFHTARGVLGIATESENGVALQLGNFERCFNLMNDGFHEFGDDGLAVRFGVR